MKKQNNKGFTLVELVIVIAVIAILAAVLIPTFTSVIKTTNQSAALQKWKAAVDEEYVEFVADEHEVPTFVNVFQQQSTNFTLGNDNIISDATSGITSQIRMSWNTRLAEGANIVYKDTDGNGFVETCEITSAN